jgi:hypothetical protein
MYFSSHFDTDTSTNRAPVKELDWILDLMGFVDPDPDSGSGSKGKKRDT